MKTIKGKARAWWFVPPVLVFALLPPYTSAGYRLTACAEVNSYILTHSIKHAFGPIYPVFQIGPLVLALAILRFGNTFARVFSVFAAISYVFIGFIQSVSASDRYGLAICTAHLAVCLFLAALWFGEALSPQSDFQDGPRPARIFWQLLLALLAFWGPVNPVTSLPDFNPRYLFSSGAGLAFCMVAPLHLALLVWYFPRVNRPILGVTSLVGFFYACGNFILFFVIYPAWWWIGVLHGPLLITSVYALLLVFKPLEMWKRARLKRRRSLVV